MNRQVFREYDIRGIVEDDFTDDFIVDLGRGYATMLHRAGKHNITLGAIAGCPRRACTICCSKDCCPAAST